MIARALLGIYSQRFSELCTFRLKKQTHATKKSGSGSEAALSTELTRLSLTRLTARKNVKTNKQTNKQINTVFSRTTVTIFLWLSGNGMQIPAECQTNVVVYLFHLLSQLTQLTISYFPRFNQVISQKQFHFKLDSPRQQSKTSLITPTRTT